MATADGYRRLSNVFLPYPGNEAMAITVGDDISVSGTMKTYWMRAEPSDGEKAEFVLPTRMLATRLKV